MSKSKKSEKELLHDFDQLAKYPSYLNELSQYQKEKLESFTLDLVTACIEDIKSIVASKPDFTYPYAYEHSKFDYWKDKIPDCSDSFKVFKLLNPKLCEQLLINIYRVESRDSPLSNEELFLSRVGSNPSHRFSSVSDLVDSMVNTGRSQFNLKRNEWEREIKAFPSQMEARLKEELKVCINDFGKLNPSMMPVDEVLTDPAKLLHTMNDLANLIYDFSSENITSLCLLITDRITLLHKIEYLNSKLENHEGKEIPTTTKPKAEVSAPTAKAAPARDTAKARKAVSRLKTLVDDECKINLGREDRASDKVITRNVLNNFASEDTLWPFATSEKSISRYLEDIGKSLTAREFIGQRVRQNFRPK